MSFNEEVFAQPQRYKDTEILHDLCSILEVIDDLI